MLVEILAIMIPIMALMIPIVAILTAHQQRMAKIVHESHAAAGNTVQLEEMKREIQALKEIVHQQAIALDDTAGLRTSPPPTPDVAQRLNP